MEPHGDGRPLGRGRQRSIWSSTQSQFNVRDSIARKFKIPISKVRVVGTEIGGGFGAKFGGQAPLAVAALEEGAAARSSGC